MLEEKKEVAIEMATFASTFSPPCNGRRRSNRRDGHPRRALLRSTTDDGNSNSSNM